MAHSGISIVVPKRGLSRDKNDYSSVCQDLSVDTEAVDGTLTFQQGLESESKTDTTFTTRGP